MGLEPEDEDITAPEPSDVDEVEAFVNEGFDAKIATKADLDERKKVDESWD